MVNLTTMSLYIIVKFLSILFLLFSLLSHFYPVNPLLCMEQTIIFLRFCYFIVNLFLFFPLHLCVFLCSMHNSWLPYTVPQRVRRRCVHYFPIYKKKRMSLIHPPFLMMGQHLSAHFFSYCVCANRTFFHTELQVPILLFPLR